MTLVVDLPPRAKEWLREKAIQERQSEEAIASRVLAEALEWEAQDFQEAAEGIRKGLEDAEAGRVKPAEEVLARLRTALESARK